MALDDGGDLLGREAVEIRAYGGVLQRGAGLPVSVVPAAAQAAIAVTAVWQESWLCVVGRQRYAGQNVGGEP